MRQNCRPHVVWRAISTSTPRVHTAAIAHALAIQIAESNSARPQSIENVNRSFTSDFSYPGFSRIAQLCGEATATTARDDAAQLSAERRLQVAHQLVSVDDAARGDTELMPGGVLQLHRWGLLEAVVAAGTPAVRAGQFSYGDDVETVEVA